MSDVPARPAPPNEMIDTPVARILVHPYEIALQELAELQVESMRFIASRAMKDFAFARDCRACGEPAELVRLAGAFVVESADDYLREGMKLFAMAAGNFESSASAMI